MHTERANAKINLYLNITSRRENGYHDIASIMQTVSLCDLVTVDIVPAQESRITLSVLGNEEVPADCHNLAWQAAKRFLRQAHLTGAVQITIQKHIPMAAGLAGGSADAAAVLRALNRLSGNPLTTDELCQIGLTLGADVPFCIRGGTMLATGVGEVLERIPEMPSCALMIAVGEIGISTPQAYAALDEKYSFFAHHSGENNRMDELLELWKNDTLSTSCNYFYNIFEDVIPEGNTDVDTIRKLMRQSGAFSAMMSGSGPAVFGVFEDQKEAEAACSVLQQKGYKAFVCHPMGQYAE